MDGLKSSQVRSCSLKLGFDAFKDSKHNADDPLFERFENVKISPDNNTERTPIMEVIKSKVQYYHNTNLDGFLSFPPSLLPEETPGFPKEVVKNLKNEDREWARLLCERNAENIVVRSLTTALKQTKTKGFIIHPYRSETYLQPQIEKAQKQRQQKKGEKLLPLEIAIAKSLGLGVEILLENIDASQSEFENLLQNNSLAKAKKKMRDEISQYRTGNLDDRNVLIRKFYQHNLQGCFFEADLIVVLKESKVILNIEIKSTTEECSLENSVSKAADQLMKRNNYFSSCHGEILNSDWSFLRAVALPYATLSAMDKFCSNCRSFILDSVVIKNLSEWTGKYLKNNKHSAPDQGQVYQKLFTRLVGYLSLSSSFKTLQDTRLLHEHRTVGTSQGISSEGATESYNLKDLHRKKLKGKHLSHLEVVCYWNPDQLNLIVSRPKRVLFDADFGVGKTLLMKQIAFELSKTSKETVYFISLGAARQQNKYLTNTWMSPTVFDVATSLDFEETNVVFLSVKDLLPENWEEKSHSNSNCLLNHFLIDFMQKHSNSHFFIDELPILSKVDKKDPACSPPDLSFLDPQNYVWITVRPLQLEKDLCIEYQEVKEEFKKELRTLGFETPLLNLNMRNSSGVVQMSDSLYKKPDLKVYHNDEGRNNYLKKAESLRLTVAKSSLPPNTVPGNTTVIVPIEKSRVDPKYSSDAVGHVLKTYFSDPQEPVVILVGERKQFPKTVDQCKETKRETVSYNVEDENNPVSQNDIEELKGFIKQPSGVLVTNAEAFGGMQARNVVLVGRNSHSVRNFLLRGISFVVVIQPMQTFTVQLDKNPSVIVDRTFLNENCQKKETLRQAKNFVWLWHLPLGTDETEIKQFLETKMSEEQMESVEITKLSRWETPIGFRLNLPQEHHEAATGKISNNHFWPLGWRGRAIRSDKPGNTINNYDFQLSPTRIVVWFTANQEKSAISEFLKEKSFEIIDMERKPDFPHFEIEVRPEDYQKVLDENLWSNFPTAKSVEVKFGKDRSAGSGPRNINEPPLFRIKVEIRE